MCTFIEKLSERESEVLRFMALGVSDRKIADRMNISVRTIKGHVETLFSNLWVNNRTEAVSIGILNGLVSIGNIEATNERSNYSSPVPKIEDALSQC